MHVKATDYEAADNMMNGNTRESVADCEARGVTDCENKRAWGAYAQINVKAGTTADFEFYFTKNQQPIYLDKVFALTILDIDQGTDAPEVNASETEVGGETLSMCTGPNSWGYPEYGGQTFTKLKHEEVLVAGKVCHTIKSTAAGTPDDNAWNPAVKKDGKYVGLTMQDREKAFIAATYRDNLKFTYEVKEGGANEGFAGRNFAFAAHASSFCHKAKADKVIADFTAPAAADSLPPPLPVPAR
jgi:hypothetical protein